MANILKKAVSGLLDKMFITSEVIDIRAWHPATMYEVEIHLPTVNMEKWQSIQRVKCRVGELEYRDYTPAAWNAKHKTCTLYIEAGHSGAGSRWVQQLKRGDEILLGPVHAAPLPAKEGRILCLTDGSALGHLLALRQLTSPQHYPIDAAVFLHEAYRLPEHLVHDHPGIEFLLKPHSNSTAALEQWYLAKDLKDYTSIYIAGNIPMVTGLRKRLKALPAVQAKIYAHGFWS